MLSPQYIFGAILEENSVYTYYSIMLSMILTDKVLLLRAVKRCMSTTYYLQYQASPQTGAGGASNDSHSRAREARWGGGARELSFDLNARERQHGRREKPSFSTRRASSSANMTGGGKLFVTLSLISDEYPLQGLSCFFVCSTY